MSDDGLVATDRRLDERSLAVASRGVPIHPSVDADRSGMTVPLIGGLDVLPFHRGASAVIGDRVLERHRGEGPVVAHADHLSQRD